MSFSKKALFVVIGLVVLLGLDFVFTNGLGPFKINDYYVRIIMLIGINVTLAVSLNIINGTTGQFSIGHAGFMAIGGYTAAFVTCYAFYALYGADAPRLLANNQLPLGVASAVLLLGLLAGAVSAAVAGLVVGVPSLRLKGDYLAIVTLGFGEIIRVVIQNIAIVGGNTGFRDLQVTPEVLVPVSDLTNFFWVFAMAALTIVIARNLVTSTFGRALEAIREDEIAAEAMGVNTTYYKVMAFIIGSALAGVAGGLSGHLFGNLLNPASFTFVKSIEVVIMIVLGGIGSITGAVFGAVVLTIMPEGLRLVTTVSAVATVFALAVAIPLAILVAKKVPVVARSGFAKLGVTAVLLVVFYVVGGFVAAWVVKPEMAETSIDQAYPGARMVIYSLMLILLMIFRPQGLLGRDEIGSHWIRRPSKAHIPVALTDTADAAPDADPTRPVDDTHSESGEKPR